MQRLNSTVMILACQAQFIPPLVEEGDFLLIKVKNAVQKLKSAHNFTAQELNWINRSQLPATKVASLGSETPNCLDTADLPKIVANLRQRSANYQSH